MFIFQAYYEPKQRLFPAGSSGFWDVGIPADGDSERNGGEIRHHRSYTDAAWLSKVQQSFSSITIKSLAGFVSMLNRFFFTFLFTFPGCSESS